MVTLCADEVPLHSSRGKHTLAVMGVIRTVISEKKKVMKTFRGTAWISLNEPHEDL